MAKKSKYYVRPDGNHESIRTINGKRVAFRGKTDREVDRKILAYQEKAEEGRTYSAVLDDWWNQKESEWAASSISTYLSAFRRVKTALGSTPVKQIKPIDLVRYLNGMKEKGYRNGTFGLDISILKMSFRWSVINGDIDISPCTEVRKPKGLYAKKRQALTAEQIKAVVDCKSGDFWLFGLMLLYTGCRRGEALALSYEDVDRKLNVIHVRKKLSYYSGNIPKMEDHTKTAAGMRDIPLLPPLADALPRSRIGLIFHEPNGEPIRATTLGRRWKAYCRDVGFVEVDSKGGESFPVTPHCFRHTFATICYDAGIDPKSTASMMGHADESITMQLYTHLNAEHQKVAADKLGDYVTEQAVK